jgi:uncharacterized metal-binding protein
MEEKQKYRCASCRTKDCAGGKDCFDDAGAHRALYEDARIARLHRAASAIEARHYCREPRIREVMLFARELGIHRLGLAFCIGLAEEAQVIADILGQEFEIVSVCCKYCGIDKASLGLEQIDPVRERETTCNPAGAAKCFRPRPRSRERTAPARRRPIETQSLSLARYRILESRLFNALHCIRRAGGVRCACSVDSTIESATRPDSCVSLGKRVTDAAVQR